MRELQKVKKAERRLSAKICYVSMFVGIIIVCAWFSILVGGIPVTLQTLGVCLAAGFLGRKYGVAAVAAYMALGFCGVPVFAGFTGGVSKLALPTGGYIVGFLPMSFVIGLFSDRIKVGASKRSAFLLALGCFLGIVLCYAVGTVWFMGYAYRTEGVASLSAALLICVLPYFPFEFLKISLAVFLILKLKKYIRIR